MIIVLVIIAFGIIVGSYIFIYWKLKEIESSLKVLSVDISIFKGELVNNQEEMIQRISKLLKKEIIIKNVLKVP